MKLKKVLEGGDLRSPFYNAKKRGTFTPDNNALCQPVQDRLWLKTMLFWLNQRITLKSLYGVRDFVSATFLLCKKYVQ